LTESEEEEVSEAEEDDEEEDGNETVSDEVMGVARQDRSTGALAITTGSNKRRKKKVTSRKLWQQAVSTES